MSRTVRGLLYGAAAVLALDTVGALASRGLGFDYARLTPISILLYAVAGAYVGAADRVSRATAVGAILGAIDATIGWAIAWVIGPGRPQEGERITLLGLFNTALFVAVLAAAAAAVGAGLVRLGRRRRRAAG
jgi:hypothetical protein